MIIGVVDKHSFFDYFIHSFTAFPTTRVDGQIRTDEKWAIKLHGKERVKYVPQKQLHNCLETRRCSDAEFSDSLAALYPKGVS